MRVIPVRSSAANLRAYLERAPRAYRYSELVTLWGVSALRTGLRNGYVTRVLPNAYVATTHAREPAAVAGSISAWCSRALVSGRTALHLYDSAVPFEHPVDVVVPYGQRVRPPSWVRVRTVAPLKQVSSPQGVDCAVPEVALLDAWHRASSTTEQDDLFYQALWLRITTARALRRAAESAPRISGRRRLMRLLDAFASGATSPLEVYARRHVFRGRTFSEFEWQAEVRTATSTRRVDMLHRAAKVAVEFDGDHWHTGAAAVRRDRVRDAELLVAGYVTLRLGFAELRRQPRHCRTLVMTLVQERREGSPSAVA